MKKILGIVVLGLVLGGCDNIGSSKTTFKDCFNISSYTKEDDNPFDEHTFEIDRDNKNIVRTMVWNDEIKKAIEKVDKKEIPKISQENLKIVSLGDKYITAKYNNDGSEYVFNLSEKTIEKTLKRNSGDIQLKITCK